MKRILPLILVLLFLPAVTSYAQVADSLAGEAGLLFAYTPKPGEETDFFEGYRSHLQWHRENEDPFPWYGWTVLSGDRVGTFIDGTFGISFRAFDQRVKPQEDADHFAKSAAPYANVAYRKVFRLEKALSTSTLLEEWTPSRYLDAYTFTLAPGKEMLFEDILSRLAETVQREGDTIAFTVYRQLTGGDLPAYLLMIPHDGFADFDTSGTPTTLSHLINRRFGEVEAQQLLKQLSVSVRGIHGETWICRQDLSYFP